MSRRHQAWALLAASVAVVAALAGLRLAREPAPPVTAAPAAGSFPWRAAAASSQAPAPEMPQAAAAVPTAEALTAPEPLPGRGWRTDARGQLVVDAALRLHAEGLLAMHEGAQLDARVDAELAALPAAAAAQARELLARLEAYQGAQRTSFPPGQAPLVPEEGLAQLDALQALRVSHFGADAARRLFGEDDAVARRLLELMRNDTDPSLTMAQKAMRAQARYDLRPVNTTGVGREGPPPGANQGAARSSH
jgi:hypothetical protein